MANEIIFVGGIGKEGEFGGELSKNKLITGRLRSLGYDVVTVDTAGASRKPWKLLNLPVALAKCPKEAPVIFSTSFANVRQIVGMMHRIYPRRNFIYWVIGGNLADRIKNGSYRLECFSPFHHILVEGNSMIKELSEIGLKGLRYVPNFKHLQYLPDCNDKRIAPGEKLRCVFFSRIIPEKGVNIILNTCRALAGGNFAVDFYGEISPEFKNDFMALTDNAPNARYCGTLDFFSHSGLDTLSKYHLTLFPTYWKGEGFPGIIIDSLAACVPILASDWNLNPEILPKECSFMCGSYDEQSFMESFSRILHDPECLNPMFEKCQEHAMRFDVSRVITSELCKEILH